MELQVLLRIAITIISIFYLWVSFFLFNNVRIIELFDKKRKINISTLTVSLSVTAGFIYSLSFIAILFVISFYPGMNRLIVLSMVFNFLLLVFSFIIYFKRKESVAFIRQFIWRSIVLSVLFFTLWRAPDGFLLHKLYADYPTFVDAYNDYLDDPDNPEVQNKLKEERSAFR
jgi:hypothetical protein